MITASDVSTAPFRLLHAARITWKLGRGLVILERRGNTWRALRRLSQPQHTTP